MQKYKDFRKSGVFRLASGLEVPGELVLRGGATTLDLYSGTFFDTHASRDIFGTFHDRSKVSLIECITTRGPGSGGGRDERYHFSTVFPHFVAFGEQHINSRDSIISEATFSVDDAPTLFYDFDAFGVVTDARPHMERIVEARKDGRPIEIGDHPQIFYFTGKHEIVAVETVLGRISATHGISYSFPGPSGIRVENTIRINIAFTTEKTVDGAIASVVDTLRFLEVVAGRPQNVLELAFVLKPKDEQRTPIILDTYWCMPPRRRSEDESRKPHPADLPLQAGTAPRDFEKVLARWIERHDEWRNARSRYATASAYQNRYDIDRLVGAANMFDILPGTATSATVSLASDLEQARDAARKAFEALPNTPERNSVLGALGRIGKATLKRKIRSRAKLITAVVSERFPELDLVVDQAVDCRNYYVHGTPGKFDYVEHFDQVTYFTDTLEFVFAVSDLLESGWDIQTWIKEGSTLSHPFGNYCVNYSLRLVELKKLL